MQTQAVYKSLSSRNRHKGFESAADTCYLSPTPLRSQLNYKRPGGRASQRLGDLVRRRLWQRRRVKPSTTAFVNSHDSPCSSFAGAAWWTMASVDRLVAQAEAQRKAIKHVLGLILDMLSRNSLYWLGEKPSL